MGLVPEPGRGSSRLGSRTDLRCGGTTTKTRPHGCCQVGSSNFLIRPIIAGEPGMAMRLIREVLEMLFLLYGIAEELRSVEKQQRDMRGTFLQYKGGTCNPKPFQVTKFSSRSIFDTERCGQTLFRICMAIVYFPSFWSVFHDTYYCVELADVGPRAVQGCLFTPSCGNCPRDGGKSSAAWLVIHSATKRNAESRRHLPQNALRLGLAFGSPPASGRDETRMRSDLCLHVGPQPRPIQPGRPIVNVPLHST